MTLSEVYLRFLGNPTADALSDKATLSYLTTLTTINDPTAIIKHFGAQTKLLNRKGDRVLNTIEAQNALCLETETTLEFINGGGAYLPGLDDNFLADKTAVFPITHIVSFDEDKKIRTIRCQWDQGSLLKQIDVIGSRAKNWPIRDGKDMARLIASSSASFQQSSTTASSTAPSRRPTGASRDDVSERSSRSRTSTVSATRDPHASLSLFQPRDVDEDRDYTARSPSVAPRQSAKPPPRDYHELFASNDSDLSPEARMKSPSPAKERIPAKSGAGKNFQPVRLFEEEESPDTPKAKAEGGIKTNPNRYDHFEFGTGEDAAPAKKDKLVSKASKHASQWKFEDFAIPDKTAPKVRGQDVRHFGWSDDEVEESPIKRPVVHHARPDSKAHFDFLDDGTPAGEKKPPAVRGRSHNEGLGLYKDHVTSNDPDDADAEATPSNKQQPLKSVINNENRRKDFGAHWEMRDDSPAEVKFITTANHKPVPSNGNVSTTSAEPQNGNTTGAKKIGEDKKKAHNSMDVSWSHYDQSPEDAKKENVNKWNPSQGYKTKGDGMGGAKGASRNWGFGDDSGGEDVTPVRDQRQGQGKKAEMKGSGSFWDF
ncbi:hypothetical protein M501DRAFT_264237 [Patellaria atrata CBS 101060]|uniref:NTF2 domain-containing protein n=1 Tax=Patellaria atrata CBS 101060 TaxID=1346257 RepID=A0A9P4VNH0_9PEZI|nr:hypothetical protein M501DRAFT_264237 [Patellaria atrata CBS 101060]